MTKFLFFNIFLTKPEIMYILYFQAFSVSFCLKKDFKNCSKKIKWKYIQACKNAKNDEA